MNEPIFRHLSFRSNFECTDLIRRADFGFFVPGVNSGIYRPASLHVTVGIEEKRAKFFKIETVRANASMTLTPDQFDELYSEMTKIKALRDSLKQNEKNRIPS